MDQIEGVRASNPGRPKRIGRSGARGSGGTRRSGSFRGGAAQGGSPGLRNQPLQGSAHPKQQAEQAATPKEIEKVAERYNHRTFATEQ